MNANLEIYQLREELIKTINGSNVPAITIMYLLEDIKGQIGAIVNEELKRAKEEEAQSELQQGNSTDNP